MKQNVTLTIASLLSILFMTFHLTDDIVRGMEPGTLSRRMFVIHWIMSSPAAECTCT